MKKLILLIPILISCVSYTKTFYRNGELLPQFIKTKCGTYFAPVSGALILGKGDVPDCYYYCINFNEDTAKLISIDSLQIIRYSGSNKNYLHRITKPTHIITDTTFYWTPTIYGAHFAVLKADSFFVSFVLNGLALSCSDTQSFVLIPTEATDNQISNSYKKLKK